MPRIPAGLPWALAGALLSGLLVHSCARPAPLAPVFRDVVVRDTVLLRGVPDTVVRWRERVVWRTAPPERLAVAPHAAAAEVERFCAPVRASAADSLPPGVPTGPPVPRALLLSAFDVRPGHLTLWGPRSDGDAWRGDFRVGRRFRGVVAGDSVFLQRDRWDAARTWGGRAILLGVGALAGYTLSHF